LQIEYCDLTDDALYDLENNVWVKLEDKNYARIGITSVHAVLAGKLKEINLKPTGTVKREGQSIATVESAKYLGIVRTPL